MSDDIFPAMHATNEHAKTGECFQCGAHESDRTPLEVCVWARRDGTEFVHPKRRMQCIDEAACDARIYSNMKKAEIIGPGPVKVRM